MAIDNIDPRELSLQDAAGMQLVHVIRRIIEEINNGGDTPTPTPSEPTDIFWCEYNVTTASEIIAAVNNNKLPVIAYDDLVFVLNKVSNNTCCFSSVYFGSMRPAFNYIEVTGSRWAEATDRLQAKLTFDYAPTQSSTNPVTSGGVWTALQNVSGDTVSPYDQNPAMDGVASPGNSEEYARGNHVHPTDTSRAAVSDIPTKVSDLQNDSGFVNQQQAASAAPVQSVNGQTGAVTVQPATDAQVSNAVDAWLAQNVAQETGYVLDSSLTMSNAAAPADKVGELKNTIKAFEREFVADDFVVNGGIAGGTGNTGSGTTRLTSDYFTATQRFSARTLNNYTFTVFAWDGDTYIGSYRNGTYVKGVGAQAMSEFYFTNYPATYRFRICVKRPNAGDISLSEKTNVLFTDNILGPDKTLSVEGEAADAKAVGDALALKATNADVSNFMYAGRDSSRVTPLPFGHYRTNGLSSVDFRDMPLNTYIYSTFAMVKTGLVDTGMPDSDWSDSDYICMVREAAGSATNNVSIITLYNYTKTRMLKMLYFASTSSNKYRWITTGVVNNNNIEYVINQYANEYNITASPSITTDTNNYLQPNGNTDMSAAIVTMLSQSGVCNLAPGIFYVSGVDMPDNATIRGCGSRTRIILMDSVTDGYAIKMGSQCTVEDCRIMGGTSLYTPTSTIGTRHGILWQGIATPSAPTASKPLRGTVNNCYFHNFSGGGIFCQGTGTGISNCLNVNNVFIYDCTVGVYIPLLSEYHRFTNVDCRGCYYGSINNGGNNVFANCGFSKNAVGIMIDNENNQSTNSAHGTYSSCVFNHSGANNDGIAIKVLGVTAREIFTGCQIFFGSVDINNCKGIVFNACNFGSVPINITDGKTVLMTNCVFASAPTITKQNNTDTHIVNCYTGDGELVTIS